MKIDDNYILNDKTKILFLPHNTLLLQNGKKKNKIVIGQDFYRKIINWLESTRYIFNKKTNFTSKEISFLKENKIVNNLSPVLHKYIGTRFENYQIYLENIFSDANKKDYIDLISKNRILFIGVGGICTSIIDYLISTGINNFAFVDFDKVDISNLNRQYKYYESDINKLKIDVLKSKLLCQYSNLDISTYNKKVSSTEDLLDIISDYNPSFIICAADTPIYRIEYFIASACMRTTIPCIFGGVGETKGTYGPLLYKNNDFKKYLKQLDMIIERVDYLFPCKGSYGITNSLISLYMASDIINFLLGKNKMVHSLNNECIVDFERSVM